MDVYGQMGGAFSGDFFHDAVYLNPGHGNGWLKIYLHGVETNRNGLGSRVFVYTTTPTEANHMHHHYMNTGGSYGTNPIEAHIGLGQASKINEIVVWWQRTGKKQHINAADIPINSTIVITENSEKIEFRQLKTFTYDVSQLGQQEKEPGTCH